MDTPKVIFISDYFCEKYSGDDFFRDQFFYLKLHALFSCLSASEIKTLYLKYSLHNKSFQATLLNFIERNSFKTSIDFNLTAKELLENYSSQSYTLQIAYRMFLSRVVKSLNPELVNDYFYLFIKSERINDRKKAYEVAEILWNDVEEIIWKNYFDFSDLAALRLIVKRSTSEKITENIQTIWEKDFLDNGLKKIIIDRTYQEDLKNFDFLKKQEPTFYIQALLARNKNIPKNLLNSIVTKMIKEQDGSVFYYLGLAKDWDLINKCLKEVKTERSE